MDDFYLIHYLGTRKGKVPEELLKDNMERKDRQGYAFLLDDAMVEAYFYYKGKECIEVHYYLDDVLEKFKDRIKDVDQFFKDLIDLLKAPTAEIQKSKSGAPFLLIRGSGLLQHPEGNMVRTLYTSAQVMISLVSCLLIEINDQNIMKYDYLGYCAFLEASYWKSQASLSMKIMIIAAVVAVLGIIFMIAVNIVLGIIFLILGLGGAGWSFFKFKMSKHLAEQSTR